MLPELHRCPACERSIAVYPEAPHRGSFFGGLHASDDCPACGAALRMVAGRVVLRSAPPARSGIARLVWDDDAEACEAVSAYASTLRQVG